MNYAIGSEYLLCTYHKLSPKRGARVGLISPKRGAKNRTNHTILIEIVINNSYLC
jgi:hypothetical protein